MSKSVETIVIESERELNGLQYSVEWQDVGGKDVPIGVTLRRSDGKQLTPDEWRRFQVGAAISATRKSLHRVRKLGEKRKFNNRSVSHIQETADAYNAFVATGSSTPVKDVFHYFKRDGQEIPETTIKGWIRTANAKGLIPETVRPRRSK